MDMLKDLAIVLGRIVTIFPLMLFVTLFMGRRSVGEMPVFDFLIILALGAVVGADIADPTIEHLPTAFAILVIGLVQKLFAYIVLRSRWFGKLVTFEPIIVIHQGKIIARNLKKARYSIDNLLHMLRGKQIFSIEEVDLAVIEGNGGLSILSTKTSTRTSTISYPIIREGRVEEHILPSLHIDEAWLEAQLTRHETVLRDIFLATIDEQRTIHITKYIEAGHQHLPPLHH